MKNGKKDKKGREKLHSKSVEEEMERKEKHQTPKIPICLDFKLKLVRFLQITN